LTAEGLNDVPGFLTWPCPACSLTIAESGDDHRPPMPPLKESRSIRRLVVHGGVAIRRRHVAARHVGAGSPIASQSPVTHRSGMDVPDRNGDPGVV
jgi:hypothetical protein